MATKAKTEKNKETIAKVERSIKGTGEPVVTTSNYKTSLIKALNYYNAFNTNKDAKSWTITYFKDKSLKALLTTIPEYEFHTLGALCRILSNGNKLEQTELNFIENKINEFKLTTSPVVKEPSLLKVTTKSKINSILDDIDGKIDDFILAGYPVDKMISFGITDKTPAAIKAITKYVKPLLDELNEVLEGKCEQLNESYSNVSVKQIKNFISSLETLLVTTPKVTKTKVVKTKIKIARQIKETVVKVKSLDKIQGNGKSMLVILDNDTKQVSYFFSGRYSKKSLKIVDNQVKGYTKNYSKTIPFSNDITDKIKEGSLSKFFGNGELVNPVLPANYSILREE
jgi:hypothetical protein